MNDLHLLDYYRREPTSRRLLCPTKGDLRFVNRRTGAIVRGRCDRLNCPACLPRRVLDIGSAIGLARPRWLITLTQVEDGWQLAKVQIQRLREYFKRDGLDTEMAYHIEHNPRETGLHAHVWTHGDRPGLRMLERAAVRAGLGNVALLRSIDLPVGPPRSLSYGMKECLEVVDPLVMPAPSAAYLEINGGRLVHASRGFWRDADMQPLRSQREAVQAARAALGLVDLWQLVQAA